MTEEVVVKAEGDNSMHPYWYSRRDNDRDDGLSELVLSNNIADGTRDTLKAVGDAKSDIITAANHAQIVSLDAVNRNGNETRAAVERNGGETRTSIERNGGETRNSIERNSFEVRDLVRETTTLNLLEIEKTKQKVIESKCELERQAADNACRIEKQVLETKFELSKQLSDCCCELKEMMAAQELDRTRQELSDSKAKAAILENNNTLIAALKAAGVIK